MAIVTDKNGRLRDAGPGWTASGKGVTRRFTNEAGWLVAHCGHPTALWPWGVYDPEGYLHTAGDTCAHGHAFGTAAKALEHVEQHLAGKLPSGGRRLAEGRQITQ